MAFEKPLEADRVDYSSPFVSLIGGPVLGTLQWILQRGSEDGNSEGISHENDGNDSESNNINGIAASDGASSLVNTARPQIRRSSGTNELPKEHHHYVSMHKGGPSLVESELSELGESAEALDSMLHLHLHHVQSMTGLSKKTKKELSWSDESGKQLAVSGESVRYEPKPSMGPVKSALSRSSSVRANANFLEESNAGERRSRYLPKAITKRNHGGLIMPGEVSSSGVDSPQWGWYINTTPPTPEVYTKQKSLSEVSVSTTATSATDTSFPSPATGRPNRIFQVLQDKKKSKPMGWSGVPL